MKNKAEQCNDTQSSWVSVAPYSLMNTWQNLIGLFALAKSDDSGVPRLETLEDSILYDASPLSAIIVDTAADADFVHFDHFAGEPFSFEVADIAEYPIAPHENSDLFPLSDAHLGLTPALDPQGSFGRQLVVIDERIEGYEELINDIALNGNANTAYDILTIKRSADGDGVLSVVNVTQTTDAVNGVVTSVANLIASDGGDGISLREAVLATNADAGIADTINIAAGTYTSLIAGTLENMAATGDFDITDDLTIIGAGTDLTFIDGGALDRVLHVLSGTVAISDLTIQGGQTVGADGGAGIGLIISRNVVDGAEVTHYKIAGITDGTLYKNDGTTQIIDGSFITFAEGNAELKFTPDAKSFLWKELDSLSDKQRSLFSNFEFSVGAISTVATCRLHLLVAAGWCLDCGSTLTNAELAPH